MNYKKATIQLICIASILRMLVASILNLGNDEVYYRLFANELAFNYFDHPPMVALLIRLSTLNLYIDNDLFIRLGAIICCATSSWFMFLCGSKIQNEKTGYFAVILYTSTIYTSIIAGLFILPDSPQVMFWTIALYLLLNIAESKVVTTQKKRFFIYFGFAVGLAFLCKVHSVFLFFGLFVYILTSNKCWFKEKVFYFSISIFLLFLIPIIYWNFKNNFVTFLYHGNRVDVSQSGLDLTNFLQFNLGQIAYQNPIVFGIIIVSIIGLTKRRFTIKSLQKRVLLYTAFPLIIVATIISLFKQVLPHWTGPAFIGLQLIAAIYLANLKVKRSPFGLPASLLIAKGLIITLIVVGIFGIHYLPKTIGSKDYRNLGSNDFTLDMYGWKEVAFEFKKIVKRNNSQNSIIVSNGWFPAAHIQHYIADPLKIPVVALGALDKIHQYHWWNKKVDYINKSKDLYVISPSNFNYYNSPDSTIAKLIPTSIDTILQYRSKKTVRYFVVSFYKNVTLQ